MAFFEELGKTLTKVGEATAQKTKEVAEFTKVNAKILEIQGKLDKAYIEVGKRYVELHSVCDEEDMKSVVGVVYGLEDQLREFQQQLQELKGTVKCGQCGSQCEADAYFCSVCGAELQKKGSVIIEGTATEVMEEEDTACCTEEIDPSDIEETIE